MPVWLTFWACLNSGAYCHVAMLPETPPFVGVSACQVAGMLMAPDWTGKHPGWRVDKIRCTPGNPPVDAERA